MPAHKHISIGEPAHDAERQAIRFLVEGLDENYVVYSNPWIVAANGATYEVDAVVVARHAIFVVEMKSYRGRIEGNDHDWFAPEFMRSPIKLNEKKAKILASELKRKDYQAGQAWVDHLVFLSHTNDVHLDGMVSKKHVHTRKTILDVLRGRLETSRSGNAAEVDARTAETLHRLLTGVSSSNAPARRMREYELKGTLDQTARYTDYRALHMLTQQRCGLRVYRIDPLATEAESEKQLQRITWEAQVLARVGAHPHVLRMETPQTDEDRQHVFVPFELVHGVTLETWVDRHRAEFQRNEGIERLVDIWLKIVAAIAHAHKQGVVHRLLRPAVVLVKDFATDPDVKVTGFDLAKRLDTKGTIHYSSLGDERMTFAAPEVLVSWSDASAASDQFGLGVLLAWMLTGSPLFESTLDYRRKNGVCPRLRDRNHFVSQTLDDAVRKMLMLRPADRYEDLASAVSAIKAAVGKSGRSAAPPLRLDPEHLAPGTRLPTEHEIRARLGEGGYGVVYLARHLVSGGDHAIKVARRTDELDTEEPLHAEERVLKALHDRGSAPGIVKPVMLTRIEGQLALIMERVPGVPLSEWLPLNPEPEPGQLRAMAEDLFGALIHLEKTEFEGQPVIHKDLKPDNMIVSEKGLTLIDFSMATTVDPNAGSALYRDPNQTRWTHASDRYSAAVCLYELYTGRHPFGREAPAPDQTADVDAADFDQPNLATFFVRALAPSEARRYPSAVAMRAAFAEAVGQVGAAEATPQAPQSDRSQEPLSATPLNPTIVACLRRAGVTTQGELVAITERQVRGISGLGKKKARQVLELRQRLLDAGVQRPEERTPRHVLCPSLAGDPTELGRAGFTRGLVELLATAGFGTVGRVADATADELRELEGVGPKTVRDIVGHLLAFAERGKPDASGPPQDPEALWQQAVQPLTDAQRDVLRGTFGMDGEPLNQAALGARLGLDQAKVSALLNDGLEALHLPALDEAYRRLEAQLDSVGGVLAMADAQDGLLDLLPGTSPLVERRPEGPDTLEADDTLDAATRAAAAGIVRLLQRLHEVQVSHSYIEDAGTEVIYRPSFDADSLGRFVRRAREVAKWPLTNPDAASRMLGRELPGFDAQHNSPLALAERLLGDVRMTDVGELFQTMVDAEHALTYILERFRPPLSVQDLRRHVATAFSGFAHMPDDSHLPEVIAQLNLPVRVEGDQVVPLNLGRDTERGLAADPWPELFQQPQKTPVDVVRDALCSVASRGGWRLIVTPPESHRSMGPQLAKQLEACAPTTFVSFERAVFEAIDSDFATYERASRFAAQRRRLARKAEDVLEALVSQHSKPGHVVVLGHTALLHTCGATHLVRKLYDWTNGGSKGLWVLVIPGVVHQTQPRFLERDAVFGLAGQVLPLSGDTPPAGTPLALNSFAAISMDITTRTALTSALTTHVASIAAVLRRQILDEAGPRAAAEQLHADENVGEDFEVWTDLLSRRAAVLWVLKSVYVRVLEDRGLLSPKRIVGGSSSQLFASLAPDLGDTAYLRWVYRDLAHVPGGLPELFAPQPAEVATPTDAQSRALLAFWRERDPDTGELRFTFTDEAFDGRLMGDLYQDLDPVVKARFALVQTPDFVLEFMLDETLTPAIAEFGVHQVRVLDPACGSGHFLLGAFKRLVAAMREAEPSWTPEQLVAHVLPRVVGIDLNDYACGLARARLVMTALEVLGSKDLAAASHLHPQVFWADGLEQLERDDLGQISFGFAAEDEKPQATLTQPEVRAKLRPVLKAGFHVVVANPPYITEKDAQRRAYHREKVGNTRRYISASRTYSLGNPFTERMFQLCVEGGYVGDFNANSFMKREFGKSLIEEVLSQYQLTKVIDTSGAYFPGYGTPTVLLFGRRLPASATPVLVVGGKRGEPGKPKDAAQGFVWTSIVAGHATPGYESDYVSVSEVASGAMREHPWSIGGGGAAELKVRLEDKAVRSLSLGDVSSSIGRTTHTGEDDVYFLTATAVRTWLFSPEAHVGLSLRVSKG